MTDILDDLRDLLKQATTERSHYYVASCCRRAIEEIQMLRILSKPELREIAGRLLSGKKPTRGKPA